MKKGRKLIAAALAAALSFCTLPLSAGAAYISADNAPALTAEAEQNNIFDNVEDAGDYLRQQLKLHSDEINVALSASAGSQDILNDILGSALSETGKGDEGEYLRLGIKGYRTGFRRIKGYNILNLMPEYNSTVEEEEAVTKKVNEILALLALDGKDEYEKISAVYSYIVSNVSYADDYDRPEVFHAYGALIENSAVCQGFIQAIYRLLTDSGISCRAVMGIGDGGDHVWCVAGVEGTYYLLDPTWDSGGNGKYRDFFMKGSKDFDEFCYPAVHEAGSGDKYNYAFVPDCTSEEFLSAYPVAEYKFDPEKYYSSFLSGDLNCDGQIDILDLVSAKKALIDGIKNKKSAAAADVNGDGEFNIGDAVLIQKFIQGSIADFRNAS